MDIVEPRCDARDNGGVVDFITSAILLAEHQLLYNHLVTFHKRFDLVFTKQLCEGCVALVLFLTVERRIKLRIHLEFIRTYGGDTKELPAYFRHLDVKGVSVLTLRRRI